MKRKKKVNKMRLSADYKSAPTPYENLISSLRHAYDKMPRTDSYSENNEKDDAWLSHLATH